MAAGEMKAEIDLKGSDENLLNALTGFRKNTGDMDLLMFQKRFPLIVG